MDLSGVISIAGMSGLYKVVAQTKNGLIVESLTDKKRVPVYATNKVSTLDDVRIYSTGDDVPLKEVLQKIYDKENENCENKKNYPFKKIVNFKFR